MKSIKSKNYLELLSIIGIATFSILLWDSPIIYPIKIFVVLLHEISHGIMAILTGGNVISIKLSSNLSGLTVTNSGNQILIAASGYLGSLANGILLFLSAKNIKLRRWYTSILSLIILLFAVNILEGGFQIFSSIIIALVFFLVPKYFSDNINNLFLETIGLTSCLYVLVDIKQDLLTTSLRETDTQILEYLTGIPAVIIGSLWFFVSLMLVYLIIKKTIFSK